MRTQLNKVLLLKYQSMCNTGKSAYEARGIWLGEGHVDISWYIYSDDAEKI